MDECIYCDDSNTPHKSHFNDHELFVEDSDLAVGVDAKEGFFVVWFDINFCPICGRDLKRRENGMIERLNEYQELAMRTASKRTPERKIVVATLGLCGEAGEIAEKIKKWLEHGHELCREDLLEEHGDLFWYLADSVTAHGFTLSEVATANIEKLRKRYPNGFKPKGEEG